jgi:NAD(P)-dependent dehydrogenase (short-subunit alcohol dehydrogenase family)
MCNAGISLPTVKRLSADGYEETFAVNQLGHFLLVNLFLDLLQPPARILFVSSGAHDPVATRGRMEAPRFVRAEWLAFPDQDPDFPPGDARAGGQAYASSKLCNVLCTYELSRRLAADGKSTADRPITVNACDPGLVAGNGLGRNGKTLIRFTWFYLLPALSRLFGFGRSVQQAGTDLAYLATAPELRNVTGKYFSGRKLVKSSAESYDESKAADLWQTSLKLCRLPSTN